jgi:hypothetical protein
MTQDDCSLWALWIRLTDGLQKVLTDSLQCLSFSAKHGIPEPIGPRISLTIIPNIDGACEVEP